MPDLSVLEIILIVIILVLLVGGIVSLVLLIRRPRSSHDEVMMELRRRRGGELTTMTPGRQVLQISLPGGVLRVGYWEKNIAGETTFVPGFYVRWKPNRRVQMAPFVLRQIEAVQESPALDGFELLEERLWYADQEFQLYFPLDAANHDREDILLRLKEHMPKLAGLMDVAEVIWLENTLSIRFRSPVSDARRAGLLIDDATTFLTNFLRQVE